MKRIKVLTGILVLICMGMLFATGVQAANSGKVKLNKTKLSMAVMSTKQLKLVNTKAKVSWRSTKTTVATVSSKGVVRAKRAGSCVITAVSGGRRYSCLIAVHETKKTQRRYYKLQNRYKLKRNQNKIVVAGSSTIQRWKNVSVVFDPEKTLNMGIGSSIVKEWLKWYKKLIVAYHPTAVVLFPGTGNQLNRGYSEKETLSDVCTLLKKLHAELPGIPIFYVSNYRTSNDTKIWASEKSCNKNVKEYCSTLKDVYYIDVTKALADGETPKAGVISVDGGHMSDKGYRIWNSLIVPRVKKVIKK